MTADHPNGRAPRKNLRGPKVDLIPLDPGEWYFSTRTISHEAKGILLDLLSWIAMHGYIPETDTTLAAWCHVHIRRFRRLWPEIEHYFIDGEDGWLYPDFQKLPFNRRHRRHIPASVRQQVMERDEFRCCECGADDDLALDHIYPFSAGGQDTLENLRVLCRPCNSRKGATLPEEV